jgi:hypothetical protein
MAKERDFLPSSKVAVDRSSVSPRDSGRIVANRNPAFHDGISPVKS